MVSWSVSLATIPLPYPMSSITASPLLSPPQSRWASLLPVYCDECLGVPPFRPCCFLCTRHSHSTSSLQPGLLILCQFAGAHVLFMKNPTLLAVFPPFMRDDWTHFHLFIACNTNFNVSVKTDLLKKANLISTLFPVLQRDKE